MSFRKLESDPYAREQEVLALWASQNTFKRSLEATREGPRFVFYEGPPTANGRPHVGHLVPRVYKDLFPRFKTMRGFHVERKAGWDCHGLPVELEVERRLGLTSKQEIERLGLERFIEACKSSVEGYIRDWEAMIRRMGFWIDLEDPYVTYKDPYIETLWWELKTIHEQGRLYQGHKILPYCPRCGTGLSSHEVAQGYRLATDPSVFVKLPLTDGHAALLVWTTTPWTLPANVAAAVDPLAQYAEVEADGERLILAASRVHGVLGEGARMVRQLRGSDLVGRCYEPLYPLASDGAYRVVAADFVSMDEGTGIVHIAPAFGEEDHTLGRAEGLPHVQPVDGAGKFTGDFPLAAGVFVKEADARIIEDLAERGRLLRHEQLEHEYPFCWRCETPLLYYAMDSWFIATTQIKQQLIEANEEVHWHPEHVGRGRFGDFLASLRDWALSRERYWGTPLPVWVCDNCAETCVIGSRAELTQRATDPTAAASVELHRPYVDRILLQCACGDSMRRVPYVLDTWFDSGSMHTAQWHYPFEGQERLREALPADFICEALDQTRGWFYTLLATSILLHGQGCYRNVLVTGMGLDAQGQKMSKSRGNVMDPMPIADLHGADAMRWQIVSESSPWSERRMSEEAVAAARFGMLDTVRNCHDFLALYATIDGFSPDSTDVGTPSVLDAWLRARTSATVARVTEALDGYRVVEACRELERYVDDLSNWYVRLSRPRFWVEGLPGDKRAAYHTLHQSLCTLAKLLAPFTPFLAEALWQSLRGPAAPDSVHLGPWPAAEGTDDELEHDMERIREIVSLGLAARNAAQIKVRQPLAVLYVRRNTGDERISDGLWELARQELNVRSVELVDDLSRFMAPQLSLDFRVAGPRLGGAAPRAASALAGQDPARVWEVLQNEGRYVLAIEADEVTLQSDDVKVAWVSKEGYEVVDEGPSGVALDTRLDEALIAEGRLRELVHRVQLARKEAGYEVTDRIELGCEGMLVSVAERFSERLAREVLAVRVTPEPLADAEHTVEVSAGSLQGTLTLRRADTAARLRG